MNVCLFQEGSKPCSVFAKFFVQQNPFKARSKIVTYIQSNCGEVSSSATAFSVSLKPFLNRHCCLFGADVSSPYLVLPVCCDFQSCIPLKYLLFMVLNYTETHKARAKPIKSQAQFSCAMSNKVVQE